MSKAVYSTDTENIKKYNDLCKDVKTCNFK